MPDNITFKERQKIRHLWIWLAIISLAVTSLVFFYNVFVYNYIYFDHRSDYLYLLIPLIPFLIIILLLIARLDTDIDQSGIYYQFFPFHLKKRKIEWTAIERAYVRQYQPIKEYGGYGIRGLTKKNRAYNVSGKFGLQILFKNGNRLLIGTQKSIEMEEVIYILHEKTYMKNHRK